jgi:hypothetical protein
VCCAEGGGFHRRKREGPLTTGVMESYLEDLHGDMTREDAYFDNRIGLYTSDLEPFRERLTSEYKLPYRDTGSSLFLEMPGGLIMEIVQES